MPTPILPKLKRTAAEKATGESSYMLPNRETSSTNTTTTRGREGDELEDMSYNFNNARRRSNSSTLNMKVEAEPVFEEELHGPMGEELEKQSTASSDKSVDEEKH
jgi:hypothetical protein